MFGEAVQPACPGRIVQGKMLRRRKMPENAQTPTSRLHAVLAAVHTASNNLTLSKTNSLDVYLGSSNSWSIIFTSLDQRGQLRG